jgi:PAS domain S-box-containing protein
MKSIFPDFIKNKSIRGLIVLIFTIEILFFAMVTGYLSYTSGLHTITESANRISSIVNDEITKMVRNYLEEPYQLEQIHKNVILNNQLDFSNQGQRNKHFVEMLKMFPGVTNTYIALANGYEYGARREDDGSFIVWNSNIEKKALDYYKYDSQFGQQGYITSLLAYDTRQRPPYLKGIELKKPGWTEVYPSATGRGLVITAVYPVYTQDNKLVGVLGSSLLLNQIDEFLKSLTVTEHSSIFIIGKNENLIASSDKAIVKAEQVEKADALIGASESKNPLLLQSIQALKEKVQSVDTINIDVDLSFDFNGEKFLLHAHPIYGKNNLEWISMILIPEKDLTNCMDALLNQLILITIMACIFGLITGVLAARYIVHPIIKVNRLAKTIAEGNFSAKIEIHRHDEIGQLVHTVNEMSTKLEQYFYKLRKNRLRIKLLTAGLETSSNLVVILDASRSIWWVNASFETLFGFTLEEVIGKDVKMILSEQNNPDILLQAKDCLINQREWRGEIIAHRKDGQNYVDEVFMTPILDDTGETSYFLVVGQDITERIKAREAILAAQEARAKAEKIFSIGTMAAGISHEINQPLNSIKVISGGILYLLNQGEKFHAEEFSESIKEISSQTDRITDIIKHLRSFIRRDENQLVPCNINTSVEMALTIVGTQLNAHRVTVQKNLQQNLPPVLAIPTGLEEIIVNLLVNAMQALDTVDKKNKEITICTYFSTKAILEISDNGPGIDPVFGETIFESFISTKLHGENLGLGLAIVNNIVASYLGTVEVTSNDMSGATFTVSLPTIQNGNQEDIE